MPGETTEKDPLRLSLKGREEREHYVDEKHGEIDEYGEPDRT